MLDALYALKKLSKLVLLSFSKAPPTSDIQPNGLATPASRAIEPLTVSTKAFAVEIASPVEPELDEELLELEELELEEELLELEELELEEELLELEELELEDDTAPVELLLEELEELELDEELLELLELELLDEGLVSPDELVELELLELLEEGLVSPDELVELVELDEPGGNGIGPTPPLLHPCRAKTPVASRIRARFFKVSLL